MSSKNAIGNEGTVREQLNERNTAGVEVVNETPELRPSVEQEIQAKVDLNHPDATPDGLTLAAEERLEARAWEIERTRVRFDRAQDSDREARSRQVAGRVSVERRYEFGKRAASVDPWADPDGVDPREKLSRTELAAVNREASRMAEKLQGWSRAAISRRLAERIVAGSGLMSAVVGVFEELQCAPGQVIPIAALEDVPRREVSIEGRVETLWEPSHPSIAQVGLIADGSGRTRVTIWKASDAPWIEEGEQVRIHGAAKNWYEGRVSVAVTGWSTIHFPERGRWWE